MNKNDIEQKRHTLAHLLAAAVLKDYPHAKLTIGPAVDNGFYYDIDFSEGNAPGDGDLKKIQKTMRKTLGSWKEFTHKKVSAEEAREVFAGNQFKIEMINELEEKGEEITLYTVGDFTDLCRGGHVENPANEIDAKAFELSKIAGAYWRGSEKNPMLTRIYGLAFDTPEELSEYKIKMEEARQRDHRLLAEKFDLFMVSDEVGKGLPLYLPNGAYIRRKLEDFMYEKELEYGYKNVYTPILTHERLYQQSGHLDHYRGDMYNPIEIEGEPYFLRPMNCPHHHQIFKHKPFSYRNLPYRLSEFGLVHRFERSGVLTGLIRARCFTQNDAHIYCAEKDLKSELISVLNLFRDVYDNTFNLTDYWFRLSLPDFSNTEKFGDIENREMWDNAAEIARQAMKEHGAEYTEEEGEAAFYGPKIDMQIRNVNGKEDTIATIQIDFYSSGKFDLNFINEKGEKEAPVIVHRAIMGSFDRFFAFLTEHYKAAFPVWLSPVQALIAPVAEVHNDYARVVLAELQKAGIQVELDDSNDNFGKKIRNAKGMNIPYVLIIGDKEVEANSVSIDSRDEGQLDAISVEDLVKKIKGDIESKKNPEDNK